MSAVVTVPTLDWKSPDFEPIWADRTERITRIRQQPEAIPSLKQFYRANPARFLSVGWDSCIISSLSAGPK